MQHVSGKEHSRTVIFTACSANYIVKALAMCLSAKEHHPEVDIAILVVDRKRPVAIDGLDVELMWAEDLAYPLNGILRTGLQLTTALVSAAINIPPRGISPSACNSA